MVVRVLCSIFFAVVVVVDAEGFPPLSYKYAVFAVENPRAAALFFRKYTGADLLNEASFQLAHRESAVVDGSRLPYGQNSSKFSDVYFVSEPGLAQGTMGPTAFGAAVDATHTWAQDDWDWHLDWHLAFRVDDLDAVAARLLRDGVPFVNRGEQHVGQYNGDGSLFFGIPGTGVTVKVEGVATLYWTEPFTYCRPTSEEIEGRMKPHRMNVTAIDGALARPLPSFAPAHQAMTSTDAAGCADWAVRLLGAVTLDARTGAWDLNQFAGGVCADLRWLEVEPGGVQLHFTEQFRKRQGSVKVAQHEQLVHTLRASSTSFDAYMHFRAAFAVDDLAPHRAAFEDAGEPFLLVDRSRMIVSAPNGYAIEIYQDRASPPGSWLSRYAWLVATVIAIAVAVPALGLAWSMRKRAAARATNEHEVSLVYSPNRPRERPELNL